ncbi:MAG: futalosine synthase [Dehalococcoidia bacterium]|nr:futalosine synthase [Dehalococcoidia bacterium]
MIRVGQIPYLNCEPFFHGLAPEGIQLCPMHPSAMGPLAQAQELDAAPFSLVQGFDLEDTYEPLGDMGIAVKGPVKSILLYSTVPVQELSDAVIGVTGESATASQLLRLILERRFRVQVREYAGLDSSRLDALLLIGDKALQTHDRVDGFPHRYDLAEEWLRWRGLPFVFALWMVRRSLEPGLKEMLAGRLRRNLAENMARNLRAIADKRPDLGMTAQQVADYLRVFRYVLSGEDFQAIEAFKSDWRSLGAAREAAL